MKTAARMHKHPLKSAGFRVLKAPDVPSVLVELGYVSNKADLQPAGVGELAVQDGRFGCARPSTTFLAKRVVSAGRPTEARSGV